MYYIIKLENKYFCKDHIKVILFNSVDEASNFLNMFHNYAMTRAMTEDPQILFNIIKIFSNAIIETANSSDFENYVLFSDIKKEKGM